MSNGSDAGHAVWQALVELDPDFARSIDGTGYDPRNTDAHPSCALEEWQRRHRVALARLRRLLAASESRRRSDAAWLLARAEEARASARTLSGDAAWARGTAHGYDEARRRLLATADSAAARGLRVRKAKGSPHE